MALKTAVLLSGSGRTLQNFLDSPELPIAVVLVVSSSAKAYGLERARAKDVPTAVFRRRDHDSHASYTEAIFGACREAGVELVLLAGFLKLLRPIPADFQGRGIQCGKIISVDLRHFGR